MARYDDLSVGAEVFDVAFTVTRADLVAYADASGDQNPIHQDDAAAQAAGLPGVIAHGMYTMGLAARAVTEWAGDASIEDYTARFAKPVVVPADGGAEVRVAGAVRKLLGDGAVEVNLTVTCGGEKVLAPARATVRVG
ncbi:MaoC/PaaZ C-terminal domain-containing protein [Phytomonospora endophytica]|uniref:Acyl dehydratase n=1 Tax=Phytomonospora endophytica TaxID=714109 RepID=A0A841FIQ9_9ACTN|nr:MaoC/PaaZ C-terminal domain-containing protein [Phytomonospora endophytica]MBB6037221.1 acyl dehydratase [Phytomonospora endophytica]GIG71277.1 MaoC family dehydratase [Phytomonospora endophytica]